MFLSVLYFDLYSSSLSFFLSFFYLTPVAGVELDQSMAQTEFNNIMQFYCADNETLDCYMLDDNGFIVSSNQPRVTVTINR